MGFFDQDYSSLSQNSGQVQGMGSSIFMPPVQPNFGVDMPQLQIPTSWGSGGSPAGGGGYGGEGAPALKLGANLGTLNAGIQGLGTLASLWQGFQAQKLAKKSFKFQKNMSLINLANQVKSYNTALADRSRSRGVMESQSQQTQDDYVKNNSLSTKR